MFSLSLSKRILDVKTKVRNTFLITWRWRNARGEGNAQQMVLSFSRKQSEWNTKYELITWISLRNSREKAMSMRMRPQPSKPYAKWPQHMVLDCQKSWHFLIIEGSFTSSFQSWGVQEIHEVRMEPFINQTWFSVKHELFGGKKWLWKAKLPGTFLLYSEFQDLFLPENWAMTILTIFFLFLFLGNMNIMCYYFYLKPLNNVMIFRFLELIISFLSCPYAIEG